MASEKAEVTIYRCDNPGCTVKVVCEDEELPDGFHGSVLEIGSWGGCDAKWFACKAAHIRGAVEGALAKVREDQQPS